MLASVSNAVRLAQLAEQLPEILAFDLKALSDGDLIRNCVGQACQIGDQQVGTAL
jgi:hypothetical protein